VRLPLLLLATLACTEEPPTAHDDRGKEPDLVWEMPSEGQQATPLRVGQFVLGDGEDGCVDCNPLDQAVVVVAGKLWRLEVDNGNGDRVVSVTRDDSLGARPLIVESLLLGEYQVPEGADRLGLVRIP
jgi:hypothetical protein